MPPIIKFTLFGKPDLALVSDTNKVLENTEYAKKMFRYSFILLVSAIKKPMVPLLAMIRL